MVELIPENIRPLLIEPRIIEATKGFNILGKGHQNKPILVRARLSLLRDLESYAKSIPIHGYISRELRLFLFRMVQPLPKSGT